MNYKSIIPSSMLGLLRVIAAFVGLALWIAIGVKFGLTAFVLTFLFGFMVDLVHAK